MLRRVAVAGFVLGLLVAGWVTLPNSLFYQRRRPTRFGRITNRFMTRYAALGGLPPWQVSLETRSRKSGRPVSNVIVLARYEGRDYVVSMLGEHAAWARNVRAASGLATIRHGRARRVRLVEVPVEERAPVLKAYVRRAFGARPHIPVRPEAALEEFEPIAATYPVFLVRPEAADESIGT